MLNIKIISLLILYLFVGFLIGCNNPSPSKREGLFIIKDMLDRDIYIPSTVNSIIGLRAGALRLLVYMDATDMVVGIEEHEKRSTRPYLLAHPNLTKLPSIGPSMGGDAELILKAKPDVIFIAYTTKGDADALQKKTGIPVIAVECPEFGTERDKLYASFTLIGKILHKEKRADSLIAYIDSTIKDLNSRTKNIPDDDKPSVYIGGVPYSGAHGINSTQPYYPPFKFVNSKNVASSIDKRLVSHVKGTYVDKEQLIMWDPDVIFIDESGLSLVNKDLANGTPLYNSLSALKNDKIFTLLPYNNYAINYELILINTWNVGKILYPENFSDIETVHKTNRILQMFFGKEMYHDLIEASATFRQIKKNEF